MKCCNLTAHNNIAHVNYVGKVWLNGVEEPCFAYVQINMNCSLSLKCRYS